MRVAQDAGAIIVGMGSNLAGKDIGFAYGTPEYAAAQKAWADAGRAGAGRLFAMCHQRYGSQ